MIDNLLLQQRILQQYPLLAELPPVELQNLFGQANHLQITSGTVVFDEHKPCMGFSLLLAGCVRVIKSAASGRELLLYKIYPGESCILTSSCLLGHSAYTARGVAESTLEVVFLPASMFHHLLAVSTSFRHYVFQLFAERLSDLMELVSAVAFQKLDQRLAQKLLQLPSPIHITHQQLADELGCAREMVSRLLKNFAEQGWITQSREQIIINDAPALNAVWQLAR